MITLDTHKFSHVAPHSILVLRLLSLQDERSVADLRKHLGIPLHFRVEPLGGFPVSNPDVKEWDMAMCRIYTLLTLGFVRSSPKLPWWASLGRLFDRPVLNNDARLSVTPAGREALGAYEVLLSQYLRFLCERESWPMGDVSKYWKRICKESPLSDALLLSFSDPDLWLRDCGLLDIYMPVNPLKLREATVAVTQAGRETADRGENVLDAVCRGVERPGAES